MRLKLILMFLTVHLVHAMPTLKTKKLFKKFLGLKENSTEKFSKDLFCSNNDVGKVDRILFAVFNQNLEVIRARFLFAQPHGIVQMLKPDGKVVFATFNLGIVDGPVFVFEGPTIIEISMWKSGEPSKVWKFLDEGMNIWSYSDKQGLLKFLDILDEVFLVGKCTECTGFSEVGLWETDIENNFLEVSFKIVTSEDEIAEEESVGFWFKVIRNFHLDWITTYNQYHRQDVKTFQSIRCNDLMPPLI